MAEPQELPTVRDSPSMVRFGPFEINLQTGELRKHGLRVRLQGKPFYLLTALLEQPGEVVTREDLQKRLWSSDTFVDFESGLNTAVNRLRLALGDSADHPIYVETLARLGYRFIAPVSAGIPIRTKLEPVAIAATVRAAVPSHQGMTPKRRWVILSLAGIVLVGAIGIFLHSPFRSEVSFERLTFREGFVSNARFTGNGDSVVYSAAWNGGPSRLFLANSMRPESRDLEVSDARLTGLSPKSDVGFLTVLKDSPRTVLESIPIQGGTPQMLSDRAKQMDWGPTGTLSLITVENAVYSVEYPPGRKIYTSANLLNDLRVSPKGDRIAFVEHPIPEDDAGRVVAVSISSGEARVLSSGWESVQGLAWHPSGQEVWFTGAHSGVERALMAVRLDGRLRQVAQIPGGMQLRDISRSGKVLIDRATASLTMLVGDLDNHTVRDMSWFDWSRAAAISANGKTVLFDESGAGGGKAYSVFLQQAGSRMPKRIGEGRALDLSLDGRFVLTQDAAEPASLTLISIDGSTSKSIAEPGFVYRWAKFFPDARQILFTADSSAGVFGLYRQTIPEGRPVPLSHDLHLVDGIVSPTGELAAGTDGKNETVTVDLQNGATRTIAMPRAASPVVFASEDQVLTERNDGQGVVFDFLNLKTGESTFYRRLETADFAGFEKPMCFYVAKDFKTFAYSRHHSLSNLFVVSGWR